MAKRLPAHDTMRRCIFVCSCSLWPLSFFWLKIVLLRAKSVRSGTPSATVQNLWEYLLRWNPRPRVCPHYLASRPRFDRWRAARVGAADFSEYPLAWLPTRGHQADRQLARPFRSCGRYCGTPEIVGRKGGGEQLDGRGHEAGRRSQGRSAIWSYHPDRSGRASRGLKRWGNLNRRGSHCHSAHVAGPYPRRYQLGMAVLRKRSLFEPGLRG